MEKGEPNDKLDKIVNHKVTMGDTYKLLAMRYHTKSGIIKKWNDIKRPLKYMIGRELRIPFGKSFIDKIPDDPGTETDLPKLLKAFLREAKDCEPCRAKYYLLNNKKDLKLALENWREDDEWEKSNGKKQSGKVLKIEAVNGKS